MQCHTECVPIYLVSAVAIYWCIVTFECFFLDILPTLKHGEAEVLADTRAGDKEKGKGKGTPGASIGSF